MANVALISATRRFRSRHHSEGRDDRRIRCACQSLFLCVLLPADSAHIRLASECDFELQAVGDELPGCDARLRMASTVGPLPAVRVPPVEFVGMNSLPHRRTRTLGCGLALSLAIVVPGCITSANTRMPTFLRAHPASERASLQRSDPLPDPDIGPSTESRPPDFAQPRTIERRAAEQRILRGLPSDPESIPPPLTQRRHDSAVY